MVWRSFTASGKVFGSSDWSFGVLRTIHSGKARNKRAGSGKPKRERYSKVHSSKRTHYFRPVRRGGIDFDCRPNEALHELQEHMAIPETDMNHDAALRLRKR